MDWLSKTALILVIVGALNWLLVGVFQWDLVTAIFGGDTFRNSSILSRLIYALVGLAGLYSISFLFRDTAVKTDKLADH
ncbi:membrane protein [Desulfosporosinus sp. Tol-M]|nr:membrane protein [Desulfosporosinus sp. Tol-M]